jgi:hypothetical protein
LTIAVRKFRVPRFSVYHAGRGSEPITEVGRTIPSVALYIARSPLIPYPEYPDLLALLSAS